MLGRRSVLLTGVLVALIGVAACSNGGAAGTASPSAAPSVATSPSSAPSASSASPSEAASPSSASETYEVKVATGSVGSYLTGEDGKTLYTFDNDTKDSGKSTCNAGCVATWPPFTVDSADELNAGDGVNGALTTISRDDGTLQAAYNGWPVYYYSGDTKAGDTNGDGFAGKWHVAKP